MCHHSVLFGASPQPRFPSRVGGLGLLLGRHYVSDTFHLALRDSMCHHSVLFGASPQPRFPSLFRNHHGCVTCSFCPAGILLAAEFVSFEVLRSLISLSNSIAASSIFRRILNGVFSISITTRLRISNLSYLPLLRSRPKSSSCFASSMRTSDKGKRVVKNLSNR